MEYQINVSLNGSFLFRTDWDNDRARCNKAFSELRARFRAEGFQVTVSSRSRSSTNVTPPYGEQF